MIEGGNQREASTPEIEDARPFRQELNGRFLPRLQIAPDPQIRDREDVPGALAANCHLDQRRPALPIHGDNGGLASVVAGDHTKGEPLRIRWGTGGWGSVRKESGATRHGNDREQPRPDPITSTYDLLDLQPPRASHLDEEH